MSLRPRYSLLTLLLLTAAIAGGMKLWRGPHHLLLKEPTIAELQDISQVPLRMYAPQHSAESTAFDFWYQNNWNGRELLALKCNYTAPFPIMIDIAVEAENPKTTLSFSPGYSVTSADAEEVETALCWISGKLELMSVKPNPQVYVSSHHYLPQYGPAYVITNQKRIYRTRLHDLSPGYCELTELDAITDESVRVQIQETLASIPDQK